MIDEQYTIKFNFDSINNGANQVSNFVGANAPSVRYVPVERQKSSINNTVILNKLEVAKKMLAIRDSLLKTNDNIIKHDLRLIGILESEKNSLNNRIVQLKSIITESSKQLAVMENRNMVLQKRVNWLTEALKYEIEKNATKPKVIVPTPKNIIPTKHGSIPVPTSSSNSSNALKNIQDITRGKQ